MIEPVGDVVVSLLIAGLTGLTIWTYSSLIRQINMTHAKVSRLADAMFMLAARLHPDQAELILKAMREVNKSNGVSTIELP